MRRLQGGAVAADAGEVTRHKHGLQSVEPLEDDDVVAVPRALAEQMSQAIAAMQDLASDGMISVAKALGVLGRPPRKHPAPPCDHCGVDVAVGLHHEDGCMSTEALHYREAGVIPFAD
ncbi:MAG: hypothetical protein JWO12_1091 [Frankiales bacterium]|nr:hypothetical protein [Frankiales bacterium]